MRVPNGVLVVAVFVVIVAIELSTAWPWRHEIFTLLYDDEGPFLAAIGLLAPPVYAANWTRRVLEDGRSKRS